MKPNSWPVLLLLSLLTFVPTAHGKSTLDDLARQAVASDQKQAATAITQLRAAGPEGLAALFRVHADAVNKHIVEPLTRTTPEWEKLSAALDAVSQQKNSYLSGVYWYTDLEAARKIAKQEGKPILSLRLLGNLSDEFSCANSRFFRTILYSNAAISKTLRERFVLHWKSVRPAPHVTIDFGDGRKLERTLTGNSIHYILDAHGRPIEALPGLYGPNAFLRELLAAEKVFVDLHQAGDPEPGAALVNYRRQRINRLTADWLTDIQKTGGKIPEGLVVQRNPNGEVIAIQVAELAIVKAVTEASVLRSLTAGSESLGRITDEAAWRRLADLHRADAALDTRSLGLILRQTQKVMAAEAKPSAALNSLMAKLVMNIALDTVRNEYLMRPKLYAWLVQDRGRSDLETFNKKVYAELFLTPASDPWLGLFTADTYMALENGGVVR